MSVRGLSYPHDEHAESAVIGSVLVDAECWTAASEFLKAGDFYEPRNGHIWRACAELARVGNAIDMLLVRSWLLSAGKLEVAGGDEYLVTLTETIATAENTRQLARKLQRLSIRRDVMRMGLQLASEGSEPMADDDGYLDRAAKAMAQICDRRTGGLEVTQLADALSESYSALAQRQANGITLLGYSTGFPELDDALSGFCPGDLIVLAARPGMGKTALANDLKLAMARTTGKVVLSLELEMSREQLAHRMLSAESGVDLRRIRAATLGSAELSQLARTADELSRLQVCFIERRDTRVSELRAAAARVARDQGPLGLLVVDYLQIARSEKREEKREREIAEISAALKAIAGELKCPVLALSQLNRQVENRTGADRRPRLSDLRESGAIEQDADTVLFLHREEVYTPNTPDKGIAEVIIGKQRSGALGTLRLRWVRECTRFESLREQAPPPPAQQELYESPKGHSA